MHKVVWKHRAWGLVTVLLGCAPLVDESPGIKIPQRPAADTDADTDTDIEARIDGELNYTVYSADAGISCELEYSFSGTPYTGECAGCSFAFSVQSRLTDGVESDGCPSSLDAAMLFHEGYSLTDFYFAHTPVLTGTIYGGDAVYYDMLMVGYDNSAGDVRRRAVAHNSESSSSTPLEVHGEYGQFIWSGDSVEWTWLYGYSGFTSYTVQGSADLSGL